MTLHAARGNICMLHHMGNASPQLVEPGVWDRCLASMIPRLLVGHRQRTSTDLSTSGELCGRRISAFTGAGVQESGNWDGNHDRISVPGTWAYLYIEG